MNKILTVETIKPKYSIIIPSRNGGRYLPTCVESIISQNYNDFELIISDDRSTDGSKEYLSALHHSKITIIEPPHSMSMAEHWEWALSHANGEWLIFVGQDDGLQAYFFDLADVLTSLADNFKTRAIMSRRAYFFWPGCEDTYGKVRINYHAIGKVSLLNSTLQTIKAILGIQNYFELPEMYTTSLFKKDLIDEVKRKQKGKVFVTHPQDANLAAIACRLEKKYLRSEIPLGWVGSSPKSAGLVMSMVDGMEKNGILSIDCLNALKKEYKQKVINSDLKYSPLAGDFSFSSCILYLWQALLQTRHLKGFFLDKIIFTKYFKTFMFGKIYNETKINCFLDSEKSSQFREILKINNCNYEFVLWVSKVRIPKFFSKLVRLFCFPYYYCKKKQKIDIITLQYQSFAGDLFDVDLLSVSKRIEKMVRENDLIEKSKNHVI